MNLSPYLAILLSVWVSLSSSLAHVGQPADKSVTLLFTNDVESTYRSDSIKAATTMTAPTPRAEMRPRNPTMSPSEPKNLATIARNANTTGIPMFSVKKLHRALEPTASELAQRASGRRGET